MPLLRTYPFIRIWNAGCATGEEAYSLAILLQEEGLYERARIYATDMNDDVLEQARAGIFPLDADARVHGQLPAAPAARGRSRDYYTGRRRRGASSTRRCASNVVFAQHDLVTDRSFNEFHVIFCRNVMIYFGRALQDHVHRLFYDSLARFGVLALGQQGVAPLHRRRGRVRGARREREALPEGRADDAVPRWSSSVPRAAGCTRSASSSARCRRTSPCRSRSSSTAAPTRATTDSPRCSTAAAAAARARGRTTRTPLEPATSYLAPADYHLLVERRALGAVGRRAACNYSRPSIDVLFESAAEAYGPR